MRDIFSSTKKKEFVGADGTSVALPFAAAGGAVAHSFGFDAEVEAVAAEEAPAPVTKGTTGLWAGLDKAQALSLASLRAARADASKLDAAWEAEKDGLQQAYKKAHKKAAARKRRRLGDGRFDCVSTPISRGDAGRSGDCGFVHTARGEDVAASTKSASADSSATPACRAAPAAARRRAPRPT